MIRVAGELMGTPLRALRRSTAWWAVALGVIVLVTVAFWPAFRGASGISEAIEQMPAGVVQAFGLEDFGTPAGFLRGNLYELLVPLLLIGAGVAFVNSQTASDETAGRLELVLAQPVSHRAVYLGRAAAALIGLTILVVVIVAVQFAADAVFDLAIDGSRLAATIALCGLLAALHAAAGYSIAGARARPALVLGIGIGGAIAGYVVAALFPLSDALEPWSHLSPWDWAFGHNPLAHTTDAWRYVVLAAPAAALIGLGTWLVGRRDVSAA
ncbi:MAG TPA: ABC transporter permease subunit [Candidatus Limnocylindrales bacterium]|nr:ABC transporter permease subunit [Candidatus Limnocylindrales bacterium]